MPLSVVKAKMTARTSLGNPRGLSTALPMPVVGVDVDAGVAGGGAVIGIVAVGVPGPTVTVGSAGVGVAKTIGDEVAVGSALAGKRLHKGERCQREANQQGNDTIDEKDGSDRPLAGSLRRHETTCSLSDLRLPFLPVPVNIPVKSPLPRCD